MNNTEARPSTTKEMFHIKTPGEEFQARYQRLPERVQAYVSLAYLTAAPGRMSEHTQERLFQERSRLAMEIERHPEEAGHLFVFEEAMRGIALRKGKGGELP